MDIFLTRLSLKSMISDLLCFPRGWVHRTMNSNLTIHMEEVSEEEKKELLKDIHDWIERRL